MAVGNLGVVMNQLRGFLASEFRNTGINSNQGMSILPEMVERIASRADLTESNLRVTAPKLFDGTNDVDVESGAVKLIAVVAAGVTTTLAEDSAVLFYETGTVTEGTTRYAAMLEVRPGETSVMVFPEPLPMAALSWSVVDNGSDGDIEGTTLSDASGTKVMLVYAE